MTNLRWLAPELLRHELDWEDEWCAWQDCSSDADAASVCSHSSEETYRDADYHTVCTRLPDAESGYNHGENDEEKGSKKIRMITRPGDIYAFGCVVLQV